MNEDLKKWLNGLQPWLSKAAHLWLSQGSLSDEDMDALVLLLKDQPMEREVFDYPDLIATTVSGESLRLDSIGPIAGIENLAPRTPLTFGAGNLTVVYGHNGSGKSGYTRILRKACGKTSNSLRHNVFEARPTDRGCTIAYKVGTESRSLRWNPDGAAIADLRGVDIFDTDTGQVYLSEEKEAAYRPKVLFLLTELVGVCRKVSAKLNAEKVVLVSALPGLPLKFHGTLVGRAFAEFVQQRPVDISNFLVWSPELAAQAESLGKKIATQDPLLAAKEKQKVKVQVDKLVTDLETALSKVSADQCALIRALDAEAQDARNAAKEGALIMTGGARLDGVGDKTWRALWEAARAYAATPYPGREFPNVSDGSKCVLCHQDLDEFAKSRLRNFEAYVQSELEADAKAAEKAWSDAIKQLPTMSNDQLLHTTCEFASLSEERTAEVKAAWARIDALCGNLEFAPKPEDPEGLSESEFPILSYLHGYSLDLDMEAGEFEAASKEFDRVAAQAKLLDLRAHEAVAQMAEQIQAEKERRAKIARYEVWMRSTNPGQISLQATKVAEHLLTGAYVGRFNAELSALGASHIKAELALTGSSEGKNKYRIQLKGSRTQGAKLADVLSEGESRIVALAAFLADVAAKPNNAPFVFDDPISSLDQRYEEKTVKRLVELSTSRQVLVFTHRLSLLGLLVEEGGEAVHQVNLRTEQWGSGQPGEVPLFAKKPMNAIRDLQNGRLAQARRALAEQGAEAYHPLAKSICSDFRILIERVVEVELVAEVVVRHRRELQTKNKIEKLSRVQAADCMMIENLMTKYSCFEHSQSDEAPVNLPMPDEISGDLGQILTWHETFKNRTN